MKKQMEKLLKELENGVFDAWAVSYLAGLNDVPEDEIDRDDIGEALNFVKDFLESRLIELEEKE